MKNVLPDSIELLLRCCSDKMAQSVWWKRGNVRCTQTKHCRAKTSYWERDWEICASHCVVYILYCVSEPCCLPRALLDDHSYTLCWSGRSLHTQKHTQLSYTRDLPVTIKRHSHPVETTNAPQRPAAVPVSIRDVQTHL